MTHFILRYNYNDTPLRAEKRPDHIEHLNALVASGAVVLAGPLADLSGGIIVLRAENLEDAQRLVEQDPYTKLDVTKDRVLQEWNVTIGTLA